MELDTIGNVTTAPSPAAEPASAASQLSSDFEVFLKMLTAQMQYQDPLNPIDSTDYATQLATFSGVEQAVQTNDLLRALTTQLGVGGLTEIASWVGKEVRSAGTVAFDGQPVTAYPQTTGFADTWEVSVRNADGQEIQRISLLAGDSQVVWSGLQYGGATAPAGAYEMVAIGRINGQVVAEAPVETYARVVEARLQDGQQMLVLQGGETVAYDTVTAIRE